MRDTFDAFEYFNFVRRRAGMIALACVVAVSLALSASLLMTKRYTATASIVIDPPVTNDPRTATAISPIYLESLKSYERFASSDTLFARAVEHFHLKPPSVEGLKRRVLKVSKIRDTKILEINATLTDPKLAQQFVQFLAQETITLSGNANLASDQEQIAGAAAEADRAKAKLTTARNARTAAAAAEPTQALQAEVDASGEVLTRLGHDLVAAETDVADLQAREQSRDQGDQESTGYVREQLASARARVDVLRHRVEDTQKAITSNAQTLSQRTTRAEQLQSDVKTADAAYDAASRHLLELRAAEGTHGERLRIIDPGVVPDHPSSPNVMLNVFIALFAALVLSLLFATLDFARQRAAPRRLEPQSRPRVAAG